MQIKEFIKTLGIKVFVEIGCNYGTDTRDFRAMYPEARIVCFEPDPRNLEHLEKTHVGDIAEIYPLAVSNETAAARDFHLSSGHAAWLPEYRDSDWSQSSSLKTPTGHLDEHRWVTFPKTVQVATTRLDDFEPLQNEPVIDFIWADVQGAEDLVFSGATEFLKKTRFVYTEYSSKELYANQPNLQGILAIMGSDWSVVHDFGGDVLLQNNRLVR